MNRCFRDSVLEPCILSFHQSWHFKPSKEASNTALILRLAAFESVHRNFKSALNVLKKIYRSRCGKSITE